MPSSFSLGPHYDELLNRLVATGRYGSASDAVRHGLRLLQEQERRREAKLDRLRREIEEGIESGAPDELDMESLKQEARAARRSTGQTRPGEA
ncbi:type II toxin-antitoxin system ParD family antitoxin [Enterovirga sp. CN4-39]|uniref:type II toxin-antitoxin system ParD family antitoxin n=1 Tax=Enterovirga sp. CN4-39 TaxID=3400910 RepID=UPI003C075D5A